MAHASGPWEVATIKESYAVSTLEGDDGKRLCVCVIAGVQCPCSLVAARLIAAAPALLAALRKAVAALEILGEDSDVAGWRNLDATYVDATIAGLLCHLEQCIDKADGVTMEDKHGPQN